ncbi:plasmid partitioning protein RepB [Aureimonas endophytica]|uniref:Plasmid partitioning protein RepB n=1 Tax=Aureimonas endophytica TaxID=2027858 RepID=A0A916ZM54_9HYPH|nr:plasmid partitioning protein RepB [Aureimonas endophytica]GGE03599.1 plasmid partitioning protein RepB [Aureimonas endophytica]
MARKINFEPDAAATTPSAADVPVKSASASRPLKGLERLARPSGALGTISKSLGGLSDRAKRADEIEQKLIEGQVIIEIDPALIDNSFVSDRMEASPEQNAAFRELIRQHGQNVPILVRPKSTEGRFEVAFGHRRLRAARELGIKVRAVVRPLTDDELVIAQGQENSGRTDLTFIERARFAARLEDHDFTRETIMAALNVDKAALSRLIAAARRLPPDVIEAIGPAPKFGRVRWQELIDLVDQAENRRRASEIVAEAGFADLDSDRRFEEVLRRLRSGQTREKAEAWNAADGTQAARIARSGRRLTLTFDDRTAPQFGDFVKSRLQQLYDEFKAGDSAA